MTITTQEGAFLTNEEKEIKARLITEILDVLPNYLQNCALNEQAQSDLAVNVVIVVCSELLCPLIINSNIPKEVYPELLDKFLSIIRERTLRIIKEDTELTPVQ